MEFDPTYLGEGVTVNGHFLGLSVSVGSHLQREAPHFIILKDYQVRNLILLLRDKGIISELFSSSSEEEPKPTKT